jgi:RNA polymerase sigma-70 factor (ECF subfamily)
MSDFSSLFAEHRHRIERWLAKKGIPQRDAPDLVQEIFRRAYQRWDPAKISNIAGWLHGIARNVMADYLEKVQAQAAVSHRLAEDEEAPSNPERDTSEREIDLLVTKIIDALDPTRKELLYARFVDELTVAEIAQSFGMPIPTVKDRIRRTLEVCRRALVDRGVTDAKRAGVVPLVFSRRQTSGGGEPRNENGGTVRGMDAPLAGGLLGAPGLNARPEGGQLREFGAPAGGELGAGGAERARAHVPGRATRRRVWRAVLHIGSAAAGGLLVYLLMQRPGVVDRLPTVTVAVGGMEARAQRPAASAVMTAALDTAFATPAACPACPELPQPSNSLDDRAAQEEQRQRKEALLIAAGGRPVAVLEDKAPPKK